MKTNAIDLARIESQAIDCLLALGPERSWSLVAQVHSITARVRTPSESRTALRAYFAGMRPGQVIQRDQLPVKGHTLWAVLKGLRTAEAVTVARGWVRIDRPDLVPLTNGEQRRATRAAQCH